MSFQVWWVWMAIAALLIVGEVFTAGFFLLWFGIAAAVAGIVAMIGLGSGWQWAIFVILSGVLFAASRKFADKFTKKQPPGIGADRFVGTQGVVLEEVDNIKNTGRIRIEKEEWRADSENGDIIPEGAIIVVTRLDGTHAVIQTVKER